MVKRAQAAEHRTLQKTTRTIPHSNYAWIRGIFAERLARASLTDHIAVALGAFFKRARPAIKTGGL
eukprot:2350139-Pyramimonas_sp.AAC.1